MVKIGHFLRKTRRNRHPIKWGIINSKLQGGTAGSRKISCQQFSTSSSANVAHVLHSWLLTTQDVASTILLRQGIFCTILQHFDSLGQRLGACQTCKFSVTFSCPLSLFDLVFITFCYCASRLCELSGNSAYLVQGFTKTQSTVSTTKLLTLTRVWGWRRCCRRSRCRPRSRWARRRTSTWCRATPTCTRPCSGGRTYRLCTGQSKKNVG